MDKIGEILGNEWKAVAGAPIEFVAAVLVVGILIWMFLMFIFSARIRTLNADLKLRDTRVALLKDELRAERKVSRSQEVVSKLKGVPAEQRRALSLVTADPTIERMLRQLANTERLHIPLRNFELWLVAKDELAEAALEQVEAKRLDVTPGITELAAAALLIRAGYAELRTGPDGFPVLHASQRTLRMRQALNELPTALVNDALGLARHPDLDQLDWM